MALVPAHRLSERGCGYPARLRTGEGRAESTPGPWCSDCETRGLCPASVALAASVVGVLAPDLLTDPGKHVTHPQPASLLHAAYLRRALSVVERAAAEWPTHLGAWCREARKRLEAYRPEPESVAKGKR